MADSDALRQRRRKAHKSGDHSLCRRCDAVKPGPFPPSVTPMPDLPPPPGLNPAAEMRNLAARLTAAHEADPANALIARELRVTLQALMLPGKADADLDGLFGALREA